MNKIIFSSLIVTFMTFQSAHADLQIVKECKLSKLINNQVLEEGLSKSEYPDLIVSRLNGSLSIQIGDFKFNKYEPDYQWIVTEKYISTEQNLYKISSKVNSNKFQVEVTKSRASVAIINNGNAEVFARFVCNYAKY